jgi:2-methylcitrate dehydratase PrpD
MGTLENLELAALNNTILHGRNKWGPLRTLSEELAAFVHGLKYSNIPTYVIGKAKLHLLDTLGVSAAGTAEPHIRSILAAITRFGGSPESTILWYGGKYPPPMAAMINGSLAHALDYDDTHLPSIMHLSSPIVATVLSVGEALHATGSEVLTALVAGYEVAARLGMAVRGKFHERGFHATSVCGAFGTASAAGKLLGLSPEKLEGALGIVGSFSSGLMEFLSDGSWIKPLHAGWTAHAGIMAALLADQGLAGPRRIFEGDKGLYIAYAGVRPSPDDVVAGLGKTWETMNISFKLFPNCHLIHDFMNTAIALKRRYGIEPSRIKEVECFVDRLSIPIVCEPLERKINPLTRYDAMFSLHYGVATALVKGWAGILDFEPSKGIPLETTQLLGKIRFCEAVENSGTIIKIVMRDGSTYHGGRSDIPSVGSEQVISKFRSNTETVLTSDRLEELITLTLNLEELNDVGELIGRCIADKTIVIRDLEYPDGD